MHRLGVALLFALLLSGCEAGQFAIPKAEFSPDVVITSQDKSDAGVAVTLGTWNVNGFSFGSMPRYATIAWALAKASVEVIAFEEVQIADLPSLRDALASSGSGLSYLVCSTQSDSYNSLALASKYPILQAEEILLPSSGTWPRSVFKVRLDIGKGLTLFVCHLKADSSSAPYSDTSKLRIDEVSTLARYIRDNWPDSLATESLVILGDMNTTQPTNPAGDARCLDYLALRDDILASNDFQALPDSVLALSEAWTWEGSVGGVLTRSALDHVFLSPAASRRYVGGSLKILRNDFDASMSSNSDHYPVVLDISL